MSCNTSDVRLWQIEHLMLSCVTGLSQFDMGPAAAAVDDVVTDTLFLTALNSCAGRCTDEHQADTSEKQVCLLQLVT